MCFVDIGISNIYLSMFNCTRLYCHIIMIRVLLVTNTLRTVTVTNTVTKLVAVTESPLGNLHSWHQFITRRVYKA